MKTFLFNEILEDYVVKHTLECLGKLNCYIRKFDNNSAVRPILYTVLSVSSILKNLHWAAGESWLPGSTALCLNFNILYSYTYTLLSLLKPLNWALCTLNILTIYLKLPTIIKYIFSTARMQ